MGCHSGIVIKLKLTKRTYHHLPATAKETNSILDDPAKCKAGATHRVVASKNVNHQKGRKGMGRSQNPKDLTRCFLAKLANSQVLWGEIIKSRESTVMANLRYARVGLWKWCSIDKESIITPSTDTVSRKCRFSGCSHLNYSATQSTARSQHCQLA